MTLPLFLAAHLAYGAVMGHLLIRRMRAEGEVIGVPLVVTLAPIGLATAPLGAVLLRYAGGWFLHGWLMGDGAIAYERFQLGLMILVMALAGVATVAGLFASIAALSRGARTAAMAPVFAALIVAFVLVGLDGKDIVHIRGANRTLFLHPAGLVSLAIIAVLVASALYARARVANVLPRPTGPASLIVP